MSFPVSIEIIISPAFLGFTLGSARNFNYYFSNSFLDPDGEGFPIRLKSQVTVDDEVIYINPGDIVLAFTYIDETQTVLVIDPTPTIH